METARWVIEYNQAGDDFKIMMFLSADEIRAIPHKERLIIGLEDRVIRKEECVLFDYSTLR